MSEHRPCGFEKALVITLGQMTHHLETLGGGLAALVGSVEDAVDFLSEIQETHADADLETGLSADLEMLGERCDLLIKQARTLAALLASYEDLHAQHGVMAAGGVEPLVIPLDAANAETDAAARMVNDALRGTPPPDPGPRP